MDIMLDLETLGTGQNAYICSIGACKFSDHIEQEFYRNTICINRKIDRDTIMWWLKQSDNARNSLFTPEPIPLRLALLELTEFVNKCDNIWANGVTFDLIILRDAYKQENLDVPWKYGQEMCLRPIRFLGNKLDIKYDKNEFSGAHNALNDCKYQTKYLLQVMKRIGIKNVEI